MSVVVVLIVNISIHLVSTPVLTENKICKCYNIKAAKERTEYVQVCRSWRLIWVKFIQPWALKVIGKKGLHLWYPVREVCKRVQSVAVISKSDTTPRTLTGMDMPLWR